jgi:hypothetical protein
VGILYKKKTPPPPNLFSFLSPLSMDVWIYMTTAYLGVSILMFLLARYSKKTTPLLPLKTGFHFTCQGILS